MNAKLLITALIVGLIAWFTQMANQPDSRKSSDVKLLTEVIKLDTIQSIGMKNPAGEETVLKDAGNGKWVVGNRHDYPANLKEVSRLITDLTTTRVLHAFNANEATQVRLGLVEPPADLEKDEPKPDAPKDEHGHDAAKDPAKKKFASVIRFGTKDGEKKLLLANSDAETDRGGLSASAGMNVRFADKTEVYRLSKSTWVTYDPVSWLEKELVSIDQDLVKSVAVGEGSTSPVTIHRADKGAAWQIDGIAADEQVNVSEAGRMAGSLASLRLNDVLPKAEADAKKALAGSTKVTFDLFDGRTYDVTMGDKVKIGEKEQYFAALSVSLSPTSTDTALKEKVAKEQETYSKWTYDVGSWIRTGLVKRREELVEKKPAPSPSPGAPPSPGASPAPGEASAPAPAGSASAAGPTEIKARHILISWKEAGSGGATRTKEEAQKLAGELRTRLENGEDFAAIAKEISDDSSKAEGGDLGKFGRGAMVPPFETAAFALEVGQISEAVESQFGFHLIQRME